jgi:uncharacterized protein (DUF58 family)
MSGGREPKARFAPGPALAPAALCGLPLAFAPEPWGLAAGLAWDAAVVVGAAIEGRRLATLTPEVERRTEPRLLVGVPNRITIRLRNATDRRVRVRVRDDFPAGWAADPPELAIELPPWAEREVEYAVVPPRRGTARFGDVHLRIEGGLGLGAAIVEVAAAREVRVYPHLLRPRRDAAAARLGILRAEGFRSVRIAGSAGEFEQLREYVRGDPFRDLDWKSSAKRRRPITRVFQQERSQLVVVALDVGRMMASRVSGPDARGVALTKLDHAVHAALLLAYVALRSGDRVGLVVFADAVRTFLPPARGAAQYRRMLEALFDVEAESTYVDFRRFVEHVRRRVPRRALLVVLTDLLDEAHARPLADHAAALRLRHLPLCVTLRDAEVERMAEMPVGAAAEAYRRAAAADLLAERAAVKAHLQKAGIAIVEAPAGELAVAAVRRYLELRAKL